jgi:hypothetical protein
MNLKKKQLYESILKNIIETKNQFHKIIKKRNHQKNKD